MYICVQLHVVFQHLLSTISADAPSGAEEFRSEATHVWSRFALHIQYSFVKLQLNCKRPSFS